MLQSVRVNVLVHSPSRMHNCFLPKGLAELAADIGVGEEAAKGICTDIGWAFDADKLLVFPTPIADQVGLNYELWSLFLH